MVYLLYYEVGGPTHAIQRWVHWTFDEALEDACHFSEDYGFRTFYINFVPDDIWFYTHWSYIRSVPDELCERGLANSFYQLIVAKCFYFEYEGTLGYITIIFY